MRITVELPTLLGALRVLATAWSRSNLAGAPACAWVAGRDTLTLRAASLEWDAQYTVPATVREPGTAWIPAALMRALPWSRFGPEIEAQASTTALHLHSDALSYDLPLLHRERIASVTPGTVPVAQAEGAALARAMLLGSIATRPPVPSVAGDSGNGAPADDTRDGVWITLSRERIEASSTDRVQAAYAAIPATIDTPLRFAVPRHAAMAIARAAALASTAELRRSTGQPTRTLTLAAGAATVTIRTLAQLPPDPQRVPWHDGLPALRVRADALAEALRAACAIGGTDPQVRVTMRAQRSRLHLSVAAQGAQASATVELVRGAWRDIAVIVPARALLSAIAPLGDAETDLQVRDDTSPVQIAARPDRAEYRALIAPVAPEAARAASPARMAAAAR